MSEKPLNRLAQEKSPYLLQHARNPVNWYPWGDEAFEAAAREKKPIFLSIGYSTCYWCHVMEHDSFEEQQVADALNRSFICVKVDREERPDVDQIYMDVVVGMTGHGGWPMSVFLTPDRKPFWGGTFFWKTQFLQVLSGIGKAWNDDQSAVVTSAASVTEALADRPLSISERLPTRELLERAAKDLEANYDSEWGGFGPAPKFPPTQQLRILLRQAARNGDQAALKMATHTLDCMVRGGINDQIGGGFARYSTDERWLVPHFEKMLYDNALLAEVLIEAYQVTKDETYADVARETLDFVLKEMTSPLGGFYSAIDAGEVDKEGEFYVWKYSELETLLTADELMTLKSLYEVSELGNFEHGNIVLTQRAEVTREMRNDATAISLRAKLREAREKRVRPHTDDKILAGWNGLMLNAMAKGFQVLRDERYLKAATAAAECLRKNLFDGTILARRFRDGDASALGFLEDYVFVIEGLLSLYEAGFEERWALWAKDLQLLQDKLFRDGKSGCYFASAAPELIVRKKDLFDGAIPSPNSGTYLNLLRLHALFPQSRFDLNAEILARSIGDLVARHPGGFLRFLIGVDFMLGDPREVAVVVGENATFDNDIVSQLQSLLLPPRVVMAVKEGVRTELPLLLGRSTIEGKPTVYLCRGQRCDLPVTSIDDMVRVLTEE